MKLRFLISVALICSGVWQNAFSADLRGTASSVKEKNSNHEKSSERLPADIFNSVEIPEIYRKGVRFDSFLKEFEKISDIQRGEFEKIEDFEIRQRSLLENSSFIYGAGLLGFVVDEDLSGVKFAYNVDAEKYQLKQSHTVSSFCRAPTLLAKEKNNTELCVVGLVGSKKTTYKARNAFGASTEVDSERGTYLSLSISRKNKFFALRDRIYNFSDEIHYPPEQAKQQVTSELRMMLVGKLDGVGVVDGRGTVMSPNIDYPYDVHIVNKGIPFKLDAIVYFFKNNGKILATRDFR